MYMLQLNQTIQSTYFFSYLPPTMEFTKYSLLESAKLEIERWGSQDMGLGKTQIEYIQALLDPIYLLTLPCSKRVNKQEDARGLRHLFYHQVSAILGWKERVPEGDALGISPLLYKLVREIWSDG